MMIAPDANGEFHCPAGDDCPNHTQAEVTAAVRDVLQRVLRAVQIRHKFDADDVKRIGAEIGVPV